jgi:cell division protein FtsB
MIDRVSPLVLARKAALPAICIAVIGYFGFLAVSGGTGLIAWQRYKTQHAAVAAQAAQVAAEKAALARQVALLDPHHVDRDLADELVRRDLGVVRPDEVILPLPDAK